MFRLPVLGNSERCGAPKTAELLDDAFINAAVMLSEAKLSVYRRRGTGQR